VLSLENLFSSDQGQLITSADDITSANLWVYQNVNGVSDQGAAYVFQRSNGIWSQEQRLTAADGTANEFFGWSVALSGSRVIVGEIHDSGAGAVFLFE
jgi:hypothetical protein